MSKSLSFQQVILKLHQFWAEQGCVIWEPYNVQMGAGTGNPATLLRVLGPEPWRVAYVEPSVRPDDGRYGENPNRMQKFYQYQVILKPDPGNPQEIYLKSLEAIGIDPREHDIRFVEDNWESPALGAWGLGWEVWLDGQEIAQYTYFQQAGGIELDPVSVEITYGIERMVLALQNKNAVWDIDWTPGISYGEIFLQEEIDHCRYYFEIADIDGLKQVYDIYENEHKRALTAEAIIPAYDFVLKCSHLFNVLDTRGAIGVTERAHYFHRMRDMTRDISRAFVEQREMLGHPLLQMNENDGTSVEAQKPVFSPPPTEAADLLLEIGVEELPAQDVDAVIEQLSLIARERFGELNLAHGAIVVMATPRRIVLMVKNLAPRQPDTEEEVKGPPANRAFDADGKPTKAAEGYARSKGLVVDDLVVKTIDGGEYVTALVKTEGRPATDVLAEALPEMIARIRFDKSMRWNATNVAFSRPVRWIVALFGDIVISFEFAGVASGKLTRGLRPYGSLDIEIDDPGAYFEVIGEQGILLSREDRRAMIVEQITRLSEEVGGKILADPGLLDEVTNLIEAPTALRGTFEEKYLELPRDVLVTVMRKHQRYFAFEDGAGALMPYFIAVRNGGGDHLDKVIDGNEHVLRARFADAAFFYAEDSKRPLEDFLPRLSTLTFQVKLGSMLDKNERVAGLIGAIGAQLGLDSTSVGVAQRAAHVAKADLATQMVVEMTSLQGVMGREYALRDGYPLDVADAIFEHWLPRGADDALPAGDAGMLLGVADRLDSLVGLFAVGLAPRSTADPYGLRRAALGVIQLLINKERDFDLSVAVDRVAAVQPVEVPADAQSQVLDFIRGRLEVWLEEQGWSVDVVRAVLAEQAVNPYRALEGVRQLQGWVEREDWITILDNFARCVRITRPEPRRYQFSRDLLIEAQEKALYDSYAAACSTLNRTGNVDDFLTAFEPMLPAIMAFFDNVMVHAEDETLRHNRLALLQAISAMQDGRADLSQLTSF